MPSLIARENIELPLLFSCKKGSKNRIDEVLEMVGLSDWGDHLSGQLSGGEVQRSSYSHALTNDPMTILADEPTGNLESAVAQRSTSSFRISTAGDLSLVIVTHNLDLARPAHKTYTLRDGQIVGCERLACVQP